MKADLQSFAQSACSADIDESEYLCGLSTILVANIQEVKDRISHIESVFCSQLFPIFQSRAKLLENRLVEERRTAENDWKKKESTLLCQIEQLHVDQQQAQEQIQQLNLSLEQSNSRLMNTEKLLKECETEKRKLKDKLEILANNEIIAELKEQLRQTNTEFVKEKETKDRLLEQIELKSNELLVERSKRKSLYEEYKARYKELKSENNFLRKKIGCTIDNKPCPERLEAELVSPVLFQNKRSFQDPQAVINSKPSEMDNSESGVRVKLEDDQDVGTTTTSDANFNFNVSSSTCNPPKLIDGIPKSESSGSLKRAASAWRDTRVHQQVRGADLHDDFLDTPMEVARNLKMVRHEEAQDLQVHTPKDMDFSISDDETQDLNAETDPRQKQISVLQPVDKGFKYVEPVRKKSERENLKGVECKQCKKFYDAVLPDGGLGNDRNTANGFNNMRCEHHEGVSRHRYRYAPPMTPEGFWNIGFESEM